MRRLLLVLAVLLSLNATAFAQRKRASVIVTVKNGHSIYRINRDTNTSVVKHIRGSNVYLLSQESNDSTTLRKLKNHIGVESAQVNTRIKLDDSQEGVFLLDEGAGAALVAGRSARTILNGVDVPQYFALQPAVSLIQADKVRGISTGAATRIATIDTGVDFNHPALRPWLDAGVDLVNGKSASEYSGLNLADSADGVPLLDDGAEGAVLLDDSADGVPLLDDGAKSDSAPTSFGHGTLVAGLIHLVAPDAVIVPIKAFDAYGNTTMFRIIESVYRALDMNVDVINMSFSTSQDSAAFRTAIDRARAAGITVVSSMGNSGLYAEHVYPAAYTGVYGVAATDLQDHLAPFSNYGKSVSVSAPGVWVVSTFPGGRYAAVAGTSFSAPLVSGTASLVASLQNRGNAQGTQVVTSAESIDQMNPGFEKLLGKGRLNARRALGQK
jgi:subtilisin family serine protease